VVDIPDLLAYANFLDDRLWILGVVGVKFCRFPRVFVVVLTTLSHYRASVWYL